MGSRAWRSPTAQCVPSALLGFRREVQPAFDACVRGSRRHSVEPAAGQAARPPSTLIDGASQPTSQHNAGAPDPFTPIYQCRTRKQAAFRVELSTAAVCALRLEAARAVGVRERKIRAGNRWKCTAQMICTNMHTGGASRIWQGSPAEQALSKRNARMHHTYAGRSKPTQRGATRR